MIYKYKKYKDIEAFIRNLPTTNSVEYSLIFGNCQGVSETELGEFDFNKKCFGCLFCAFGSMKDSFLNRFNESDLKKLVNERFSGKIIPPLNANIILGNPYKNLEAFTKIAETRNIQPWAAGLLQNISEKPCRIGMEVHSPNLMFDRDGRLDICVMTNNYLIVLETKTTLDDALNDERFVEQHAKYSPSISAHINENDFFLGILIGGKETDLLPTSHRLCTSLVGDKSSRFYKLISEYSIPFISANALWLLSLSYFLGLEKRTLGEIFRSISDDKRVVGVLTAGKIIFDGNEYKYEKI